MSNISNGSWVQDLMFKHKKVYSQFGQDGVIEAIVDSIHIDNKFCVEFGWNSTTLTGGTGPNCANLVANKHWNNVFFGQYDVPEINAYKCFLTTENILSVFQQHNVPTNVGYISVDVDSTDLWLLDALLQQYKPSFYSVEFNCNIPSNYAITFPNDVNQHWQNNKVFGASLKCFEIVAAKYEYTLVYMDHQCGHDAFYVRNNLMNGAKGVDYRTRQHHPLHSVVPSNGRHALCLDYEHYLATNNVHESQLVALPVTTKYLTNYEGL